MIHSVGDGMKKQLLIVGIILLLIAVGLSGCTNEGGNQADNTNDNTDEEDFQRIAGTWDKEGWSRVFALNGSYYEAGFELGTWQVTNGKLIVVLGEDDWTREYDSYTFSDNDMTLTLTISSQTEILTKVIEE